MGMLLHASRLLAWEKRRRFMQQSTSHHPGILPCRHGRRPTSSLLAPAGGEMRSRRRREEEGVGERRRGVFCNEKWLRRGVSKKFFSSIHRLQRILSAQSRSDGQNQTDPGRYLNYRPPGRYLVCRPHEVATHAAPRPHRATVASAGGLRGSVHGGLHPISYDRACASEHELRWAAAVRRRRVFSLPWNALDAQARAPAGGRHCRPRHRGG